MDKHFMKVKKLLTEIHLSYNNGWCIVQFDWSI